MNTNIIGIRPPERPAFPTHIQWTGENKFLSLPEIETVIKAGDALELRAGTVGNGGNQNESRLDEDYRCVETGALNNIDWLYERIISRVKWANDAQYRFTLNGIAEPVGYLRYTTKSETQKVAGHYDWHQDFGGGPHANRKLSLIIQLTDPSEYDGCRLTLFNDGEWEVPYVEAGDAIMFPSWTPHRVSDIERGVRRALVVWIAGPQFA